MKLNCGVSVVKVEKDENKTLVTILANDKEEVAVLISNFLVVSKEVIFEVNVKELTAIRSQAALYTRKDGLTADLKAMIKFLLGETYEYEIAFVYEDVVTLFCTAPNSEALIGILKGQEIIFLNDTGGIISVTSAERLKYIRQSIMLDE